MRTQGIVSSLQPMQACKREPSILGLEFLLPFLPPFFNRCNIIWGGVGYLHKE